jgi:dTDP-glucose 4,6-dehydratase
MITGGAGFIGANFIRFLFEKAGFRGRVVNYDKLTYAGNPLTLSDIDESRGGESYFFVRGDICDFRLIRSTFEKYEIDAVINFAAESHVDRSIHGPGDFITTNINGTFALLEAARDLWARDGDKRFLHVSTDEVYGSLGPSGHFFETTPYDPRSPYSASKASSDHLVRAYRHTYGLPCIITNCSNNYGPFQFPEKLIPLMILNAIAGKELPVYGDGSNVRDWLFVEDHCEALYALLQKGVIGETYNIGGECEKQNIEIVRDICEKLERLLPSSDNPALEGKYEDLITFVQDRPGHDRRYAINCDKLKSDLGWKQRFDYDTALEFTVKWYLDNTAWVNGILSLEYQNWIEKNYGDR